MGFKGPVVAYGAKAIHALSGMILSPLDIRGSILPVSGAPGWFTASIHPAFILRAQSKARGAEQGKAMDELYPLLALDASRAQECSAPRVPRVEMPTVEQLRAEWLRERPTIVSVDIEGKDGIPKIVGVGWRMQHTFVLDWSDGLRTFLDEMFATEGCLPLFHNANYDIPELREAGVRPPERWLDTINIAALEDPSLKLRLQVQVLCWVLGTTTWKGLIDHEEGPDYTGGDVSLYRDLWTEILTRLGRRVPGTGDEWYKFYNGLDTAWTFELFHTLRRRQTADGDRFNRYYMQVMMPVQGVLMEMTERGMPFAPDVAEYHKAGCVRLERMAKGIADKLGGPILVQRVAEAEAPVAEMEELRLRELSETGRRAYSRATELTKLKGKLRAAREALEEGFNIESNKQRTSLVYDWFGLPVQKNDAGNPTADEDALTSLYKRLTRVDETGKLDATVKPKRGTREEVGRLLKALIAGKKWPYWRRNYLEPPLLETPNGPWLITQYSQHRADTGRVSSGIDISDPEKTRRKKVQQVQNIPRKLRDVVRAEPGRVFVAADWSAIQWALAMWSASKVGRPPGYHLQLLEQQQCGEMDPHTFLASIAFGLPESEVTGTMRQVCKAYTFGYLFDGSPLGLADNAGHKRSIGERVCAAHDRAYKTRPWKDATIQAARERRYVETPLGWRRWFWGLDPKATEILATLIQAMEADLLKWTLASIPRGVARPFDYRLMTTTHDSIMIDCPEKEAEVGAGFLRERMQQPVPWLDGRSWKCKVKVGGDWRAVS
jgi:DNA polymerase I-like protein with 3'-5' exonuclease and polymerase domains